ncbi:MAG: hypothetical protein ACI9VS_003965, partial [Candidatus Binatia bacterium]
MVEQDHSAGDSIDQGFAGSAGLKCGLQGAA